MKEVNTIYPASKGQIEFLLVDVEECCQIPIFSSLVAAGFPSPADDYLEGTIDLNTYFIQNPSSTYIVRIKGDSMIKAHIQDGDMLVVDKSIKPVPGHIVVALLNGEFVVKRLHKEGTKNFLKAENDKYPLIEITPECDFRVWGVGIHVMRKI